MTTQQLTNNSQSMTSQNPIVAAVTRIRALQDDLTPAQRAVRDLGRQRTREAVASGAFSLTARR